MIIGFPARTGWALLIALVTAIVAFTVAGPQAALIALVGSVAAAMMALGIGSDPAPAPPVSSSSTSTLLETTLDVIVQPVLIVRGTQVIHANHSARALLGDHVIGQDARLAIRHPAATERLTGDTPIGGEQPIELVGIGALDQRWEMRVGEAEEGMRIVHLLDRTGNYAAERMRVDFVANASHELRTPLSSILGFVETLSEEAGEDPAVRTRFLKIILDEAQRMQRLVEDLISLSRIEGEKYRLPAERVCLATLVADVRAELLSAASEQAIDLATNIDRAESAVSGDRAQLSQLLHNLVGNAMKYGRKGTPVTIRLDHDDRSMIRLVVSDQGEGIPPEHVPRLTERFYRVDPGRSRAMGGTGLGLAIVKHIVERHRGRLDIQSVVGTGTTVTVILPPDAARVTKV